MIGRAVSLLILLWALGFALFALALPGPAAPGQRADAAVVPTGGAGRVDRGLELVEAGAARRMLVSGAAPGVTRAVLARTFGHPATIACCVDIGAEATDTRGNADETVAWLHAHGYRSLLLVTSDWHLRRARMELEARVGPGVHIVADGVKTEPTFGQLMNEYNKLLLRRIVLWVEALRR